MYAIYFIIAFEYAGIIVGVLPRILFVQPFPNPLRSIVYPVVEVAVNIEVVNPSSQTNWVFVCQD